MKGSGSRGDDRRAHVIWLLMGWRPLTRVKNLVLGRIDPPNSYRFYERPSCFK